MNALTCRPLFLMPCPAHAARTAVIASTVAVVPSNRPIEQSRNPVEQGPTHASPPSWRQRFSMANGWRRASRFAGGFLIGVALWAMVFAASAASQFAA